MVRFIIIFTENKRKDFNSRETTNNNNKYKARTTENVIYLIILFCPNVTYDNDLKTIKNHLY